MSVESDAGAGSKFTITLPMVTPADKLAYEDKMLRGDALSRLQQHMTSVISSSPPRLASSAVSMPSSDTGLMVAPPSRAIPGLSCSDPLDAVGLSDDEETEIRKLGANDIREDSHPSLQPPIRPTVEPQLSELKKKKPMSPKTADVVHRPAVPPAGKAAQDAASATQQPPGKRVPASARSSHKPQKPSSSKPSPYADIRIMVVDDSEVNKKLLCKLLAMVRSTSHKRAHKPQHAVVVRSAGVGL